MVKIIGMFVSLFMSIFSNFSWAGLWSSLVGVFRSAIGYVGAGLTFGLGVSVVKIPAEMALFVLKKLIVIVLNVTIMLYIFDFFKDVLSSFSDQLNSFFGVISSSGVAGQIFMSFFTRFGFIEATNLFLSGLIALFVYRMLFRLFITR